MDRFGCTFVLISGKIRPYVICQGDGSHDNLILDEDRYQSLFLDICQNRKGNAYAYAYDDNGNITSITRGSTFVTYAYIGTNELVRENNGFINTHTTNEAMHEHGLFSYGTTEL